VSPCQFCGQTHESTDNACEDYRKVIAANAAAPRTGLRMQEVHVAPPPLLTLYDDKMAVACQLYQDGRVWLREGLGPDDVGTIFADLIAEQLKRQAQPPEPGAPA